MSGSLSVSDDHRSNENEDEGRPLTNESVYRLFCLPFKRLQFLLQITLQVPICAFGCDIQQVLSKEGVGRGGAEKVLVVSTPVGSTLIRRRKIENRERRGEESHFSATLCDAHQVGSLTCFICSENGVRQALDVFLDRIFVLLTVTLAVSCCRRVLAKRPGLWIKIA